MCNQDGWRSNRRHNLESWEDEYWTRGIPEQRPYPYRNYFPSEIDRQETYELQTFESHVHGFHTRDSDRYYDDERNRTYHTRPRRYVDPYRKWEYDQDHQMRSYDPWRLQFRNAQPVTAQVPVRQHLSESMHNFHNTNIKSPPGQISKSMRNASSSKTKVKNKKNTKTSRNDKNLMNTSYNTNIKSPPGQISKPMRNASSSKTNVRNKKNTMTSRNDKNLMNTSSNGNIKTDEPPSSKVKTKDSKSDDTKLCTVADTSIMQDMEITPDVIIDTNSKDPLIPIEMFEKLPLCKVSNQIEKSNKSLLSNISTCDVDVTKKLDFCFNALQQSAKSIEGACDNLLEDSIDKVTVSGKEQNSDFMENQKDVISQDAERTLSNLKQKNEHGEFPSTVSLKKVMDSPDLQKRSPISCEASTSHGTRSKLSNGNHMEIDGNGSTLMQLNEVLHCQSRLKSHQSSCEQVICISSESESDNASDKMCAVVLHPGNDVAVTIPSPLANTHVDSQNSENADHVDKSLLPGMQAESFMCSALNTKINSSPLPSEAGCGKHSINVFKTPDHYPCPNLINLTPNCGLQDSGNEYPLNKTESVVQLKNDIDFGNHLPSRSVTQLNSIKHKEFEDVPISNTAPQAITVVPVTQQLKLQDYSESENSNLNVKTVSSDIVESKSPLVTSEFVTLQEPSKDLVMNIVNNNVEQVSKITTSEASIFKSGQRKDINKSSCFTNEAVKQTGMSNSLMASIQKDKSSFKSPLKLINSDKRDNQEMIDTTPQNSTEKINSNSGEKYKSSDKQDFDNKCYAYDAKRYGNHTYNITKFSSHDRTSEKVNYGGGDFVKDMSNTDKRRIYNRNNAVKEYPSPLSKQASMYRYANQYDRKMHYNDFGRKLDKRTVSHKHYTSQDNLQDGRSSSEDVSEERRSIQKEDLVEIRASSNDDLKTKTGFIKYSSRIPYRKSVSEERRFCRKIDFEGRICSSKSDSRERRSDRRSSRGHDSGGRQPPSRYDSKLRRSFRKHYSEKRHSPGKCLSNERRCSTKYDSEQKQLPHGYYSKSSGKGEWSQSSGRFRYYSNEIISENDGCQQGRSPGRYDSKEGRSYSKDDCKQKESIGRYASKERRSKNDVSVQNRYLCGSDSKEGTSSTKTDCRKRQSPGKYHSKEKRSRKDSSQERQFSSRSVFKERKYYQKDDNEESRHSRIVNVESRHHGRNDSEDRGSSKIECETEGRYHERYYGENYSKTHFNTDKFNNLICDGNTTKPFASNSAAVNNHEKNEYVILVKDQKIKDFSPKVQQYEVNLVAKTGHRSTETIRNIYSESKNSQTSLSAKPEICSMDKDKKMTDTEIDRLDKTVTDQQYTNKNLNKNLILDVAKPEANVTQKKCNDDELLSELQHSEVPRYKGGIGFPTNYETCNMDRKEGKFETKLTYKPAEIKKTVIESFENNDTSSSILGKQWNLYNDETDGSTETMVNNSDLSNSPIPLTTDSDQYIASDNDDETTAAADDDDDCMSHDSLILGLSTPDRLDQDISSDDEELEKEITLQEIQKESPVRKTLRNPSSICETSCSVSCSVSLIDCNTVMETKSSASARFLNELLAEKEEVELKNGDLLRIQNKLKDDIERGGFVKVFHEDVLAEEELLPEHTKELERLQVSQSVIVTDVHPGETLFSSRLFLQVFDETLKPAACGFKPDNSLIDQQINNINPGLLSDFLTSGILTMCFHRISCPDAICRWLFYIMSIHSNSLVIHSCQRTLMDIIKKQTSNNYDSPCWTPSPLDVLKIFINYGSEKQVLIPDQNVYSTEQISDILQPSVEDNQDNNNNSLFLINRDNLLGILDTLSFALQGRSTLVTKEITMLIEILMKAAMDKSLNNNKCHYEFQVAMSSALECYSETSWPEVVPYLSRRITNITSHHHNRVYLLQLLPPGFRGHHVQKIAAAMILHEELIGKPMKECPKTVKISSLFKYVDHMRGLSKNVELYKLSSCIMLMDLAVGSETTKSIQKLNLYRLSDMINTLKGDLRDSVQMLDQTRVKDLMVRISSKWKLMTSTMGSMPFPWSKQTSPQKMKVETLEAKSDNESDGSDTEMSNRFYKDSNKPVIKDRGKKIILV